MEKVTEVIKGSIEIIKGVKEIIGGGDFTVTSDRISTSKYDCDSDECPWQPKREKWLAAASCNWPFTRWQASALYLVVAFEYDGCDVKNARILISSESWIGLLADGRTYEVTARATESGREGKSGCECCRKSACVEFDVKCPSSSSLGSTGHDSYIITICGDGTVTREIV